MSSKIYIDQETPIVWADTTDFSSPSHGFSRTAQMNMENVANNAAWQGAKVDLGAVHAESYTVVVGWEPNATPTAGLTVEYYWSASNSGTAGTGNAGGASGTDLAYQAGNEDAFKAQLEFLGRPLILTATATGTVQIQTINNRFIPPTRYGMPVMVNKSGVTSKTTATNHFIALIPNPPEIQ